MRRKLTKIAIDICPPIVSVEEKQSSQEFQLFFSSVNMEGNQTRFNECSDSDIKKLVPLAFFTMFTRGLIAKRKYIYNKPLSGLLVCRLIMSLAERLSSKFHICPRSFASWPNVHFSDNLSAADIISRHTSRLKGFIGQFSGPYFTVRPAEQ